MATVAVFVALGGGAYAALKLPKNSVGTIQLKKKSVSNAKLATNAVTASKVARGSLTGAQINASTLGTVPSATTAAHATAADSATTASQASNANRLEGLSSSSFVQGGGSSFAARGTLNLGGGGLQHILTIPGFGEIVGGCGSGGGAAGFVNHAGHSLRVFPFAGTDQPAVTIADGASTGLFPAGVGGAGYTLLQIGSTDFNDQKLLSVTVAHDATSSSQCNVQAWAITR